mgnify:CR=1 FL=1
MRILLLTHITMGYGSPEMLNLYKVLESKGHAVYISDQEDNIRSYYQIDNINRFFRRNISKMTPCDATAHRQEMLDFIIKFDPDVLISSFLPFLKDKKFPLNKAVKRIFYAAEMFNETSYENIDCLISPNEDRLRLLSGESDITKFVIYNAPLLSEHRDADVTKLKNPEVINILYQGQISKTSGVDILIKAVEKSNHGYLHLCGDIRDESILPLIEKLQAAKKLSYHGFLKQKDLDNIRNDCHVGFIGWREDLSEECMSIKYCCPTKLYDYISFGMPVIFIKNHALYNWNESLKFGYPTSKYSSDTEVSKIIDSIFYNQLEFTKRSKHCLSLYKTLLNYEFQSDSFINYLESQTFWNKHANLLSKC